MKKFNLLNFAVLLKFAVTGRLFIFACFLMGDLKGLEGDNAGGWRLAALCEGEESVELLFECCKGEEGVGEGGLLNKKYKQGRSWLAQSEAHIRNLKWCVQVDHHMSGKVWYRYLRTHLSHPFQHSQLSLEIVLTPISSV